MEDQGMFKGAKTTVTTPELMNIDYLYDISGPSIFATEQQAGLFNTAFGGDRRQPQPANAPFGPTPLTSKFVEGGQVEDENDRLLRILGEI
jgi:hypothetical protein